MSSFWVFCDAAGSETGRSEGFADRGSAEGWITERWPDLLASGVEEVVLHEDGVEAYRMSLREG
jgi:hypothetical protein